MPSERTKRNARKMDRAKVVALAKQGMSTLDIARHQNVSPSTVWRFLQQTKPERQALELFKAHRADVLARLQAKSLDAQERILDTLDDGMIGALAPSQKTGLLMALNAQHGTLFDKERLERGESTSNISIVSRMLESVTSLHKRQAASKQSTQADEQADVITSGQVRASPDAKAIRHEG